MSYYQPYPPTHNVSFSRFSNSLPPRYIHDLPEYPPPPLYYEHPYRPSNTYLTKYNHSLEPTRVISNPNRSINQPIIQQENEDSTHGNFFRDRPRIHNTDFEIFINAMKEQIILLRDAEKIKEKLAFTEDFNIDLIYKKFDDNNNDNVSLKEFKQTLNNLGVPASEKESYLVIRQYSGNDRLTSKEFELLFLPKSGLMKNKLLQKDKNLDFIFKQETLELCKELLNVHLRLEACWEKFKQKLQLRKTNLKNLFKLVDVDQNDGMEASDLKQILEKNHMIPSIEEIEWVFHRFDDRNKKQIGFNEFLNELTRTPSPPVIPQLQKFIEIIQKQMEIEKKIEQKKADLIKMREFDFEKVYRIFDDNNSGAISYQEFRVGLMESFEVKNVQEEDLMQLFQTYNINDDGKLAKIELKKMIYPSDTQLFQKLVFQPGALSKKNEGNYKFQLATIFQLLLEGEKDWKNAKKFFEKKEDTLKLLFKQMDYDKDDLLKESDFRSFLQETGFVASSSEIFALIRRFDRNGDCNIDLEEFLSELGKGQKKKKIELDFSDELVSLFKGVKEFFNKIEKARAALLKRYDFNVMEIIEIFDDDKTGQISIHELKAGFNVFGVDVQDKECYLICRRYSVGKKFFLSYEEFIDLFNPHSNIRKKIELPGRKYLSNYVKEKIISHETKQYLNALFLLLGNFEIYWNGIKTTMQQKKFDVDQAFKNLDTNKDNLIDQKDLEFFFQKNELTFDKHEQNFILFLFEPRLTGQISKEAFKIELSPIEKFDEVAQKVSILEDINEILREIVKVCREIETHKQNLNQHDFNMKELFLLLDINGGGILTKDDVYEGLKKLHIDISDSECRVLMREYCVDNDLEVMNFESFRQMFLPLNQIHSESSLKSSRITSNINKEDLKHIGAFFKNIVNSEKKAERFRQSLVEKKVDLMKVFKVLDSQNDGFLSGEDFIKFIIKSDISSNKNDINLLVSRFDKDKSNSISREEFVMELLPTPASYGDKGDDVELLKAILTEQIIRLRILEQRKIELIKRKNFRIYEIFNYLDENESGTLNNVELRSGFIDVFGIKTTWEEINMIIYKYSRYKDELVMELQDFQQIFIPIIADYKNLEAFSKPVGKMKIKKNIDESLIDLTEQYFKYLITYESFMRMMRNELQKKGDLKKLFSLLNTKRTAQITWQNFKEFAIKYDISHTEDDIQILFSIYDITKNGKISEQEFIKELIPRDLSNLFKKKLENFDYLKVIILEMKRILRDVEKWRETLAGQTDFKLFNLYNMFDLNDSHQISKEEVFRFFKKHGILANERLIELVMHKYSFDNNDLMSWAEFCLMMMPTSKNKNMEKLLDTNKYGYNFQKDTWQLIKKMFQIILEGEWEFEILRRNIKAKDIHLEALFRILDRNEKGQVSREFFAEFLQKNKILIYPLDIKCLIKRLDKNGTGYISQKNFVDELKPT